MKKVITIAICSIGILAFSSCRSTSKHCGLAKNDTKIHTINIQQEVIVAEATTK